MARRAGLCSVINDSHIHCALQMLEEECELILGDGRHSVASQEAVKTVKQIEAPTSLLGTCMGKFE